MVTAQEQHERTIRIFAGNRERPVTVWDFEDAPTEYQALSKSGGDEDYIALVPAEYEDGNKHDLFNFLTENGSYAWFGCCDIDVFDLPNGDKVYIGSHA